MSNNKIINNNSIHYSDLSNKCVDAFANLLTTEGHFLKVINYSDSTNFVFLKDSFINYPELHKKIGADAFIFLDSIKFEDYFSESKNGLTNFILEVKENFPEFKKSTKVENIKADLLWTVTFKMDTTFNICVWKQPDNLFYGNSVYPELFGSDFNHKLLLTNTAEYLGKSFASKIIPTWNKVNRIYYRSNNDHMLIAEKYLLDNNWMKAAEIYNKETTNKNQNIAAKATYNMALVCEMEGKFDAATDWLIHSYSIDKKVNQVHQLNCKQYIELIAIRKMEIQRLEKQIRIK